MKLNQLILGGGVPIFLDKVYIADVGWDAYSDCVLIWHFQLTRTWLTFDVVIHLKIVVVHFVCANHVAFCYGGEIYFQHLFVHLPVINK